MATVTRTGTGSKAVSIGEQRSYSEIVDFLNARWKKTFTDSDFATLKALDKALGEPSKKLTTVLVGGTNGKSLTINFSAKLLAQEGVKVGAFYSPHIMNYNERLVINNEAIANKAFVELANEVINTAQSYQLSVSSFEILTMMALLYFVHNKVEVAFLEMLQEGLYDPTSICTPQIMVITRLTDKELDEDPESIYKKIENLISCIKPGTYVVSGDQSKLNLQTIAQAVKSKGGVWEMPIRKLAGLRWPYEPLHGRCAALAERLSLLFIAKFAPSLGILLPENGLLSKQTGQRGRPTIDAKRKAAKNPRKTLSQYWKEVEASLFGRFHLLEKEKPTVLLDNASNIDAIKNLLLGVKLLNYQRALRGLALVLGCDKNTMNNEELLRLLRYFTKKNSAHIIFCPISGNMPGVFEESWNVEEVMNNIKSLKIKAKAAGSFQEAFEIARKLVEDRHGLVVIGGSQSIISEYWKNKGLKSIQHNR